MPPNRGTTATKAALFLFIVLGLVTSASFGATTPPAPTKSEPSKLFDSTDGWVDISAFLDTSYGFVPLAMPITEPAVGYGLAGGLAFVDRNPTKPGGGFQRPNFAFVGGFGTENESQGAFAMHSGSWHDGRLETVVGVLDASVNLDFSGIGADSVFNDHPVRYNLKPIGGMVEARYRLGRTPFLIGLRYVYSDTTVRFPGDRLPAEASAREFDSKIGGVEPALTYDTRDNILTPTRGNLAKIGVGIFDEIFGSSTRYEIVSATLIDYRALSPHLTFGTLLDGKFSFDDVPFYVRPFVSLRGVEALRYSGGHAAQIECEARWQCWRRFSLVGFVGAGIAWTNTTHFDRQQDVVTGGGGFRYEIARKFGLHLGLDVGFGPDEPILYLQFGSAWLRP